VSSHRRRRCLSSTRNLRCHVQAESTKEYQIKEHGKYECPR
jgi:hypothetical protein